VFGVTADTVTRGADYTLAAGQRPDGRVRSRAARSWAGRLRWAFAQQTGSMTLVLSIPGALHLHPPDPDVADIKRAERAF